MNYNDCWTYPKAKIDSMIKQLSDRVSDLEDAENTGGEGVVS